MTERKKLLWEPWRTVEDKEKNFEGGTDIFELFFKDRKQNGQADGRKKPEKPVAQQNSR